MQRPDVMADAGEPHPLRPERGTRTRLLLGAFLAFSMGGAMLARYARQVPRGAVVGCTSGYSHGPMTEIRLADGRSLRLVRNELTDLDRSCPGPGTSIEKRRGELFYRVNGEPRPVNPVQAVLLVLFGVLGGLLILAGAGRAGAVSYTHLTLPTTPYV